jgi:AcrR family transcriptional regulator
MSIRDERASPRKLPRQERSRATVDAILTAATQVFREQGYERATTARIAEVAGVSVGSLYQYFPDKASLAVTIGEQLNARFASRFAELAVKLVDKTLEEKVRAFASLAVQVAEEDPALISALLSLPTLGDVELPRIPDVVQDIVRNVLDQHRGELDVADVDVASFVVITSAQAIVIGRHALRGTKPEADQIVEQVVRLVLRYLRA